MPCLLNMNSYLHQSSLLVQAYPATTRVTTKYSLPRKRKADPAPNSSTPQPGIPSETAGNKFTNEQTLPAATLTFKTFENTAGICLKYQTNKAAEVGRLMNGLGRLAKGEIVEESSASAVDHEANNVKVVDTMNLDVLAQKIERLSDAPGRGGKAKKKKGKK